MLASFIEHISQALLALPAVLFVWCSISLSSQRLHDAGLTAHRLWWMLIPVIGPTYLFITLMFKRGEPMQNKYGAITYAKPDYLQVNIAS